MKPTAEQMAELQRLIELGTITEKHMRRFLKHPKRVLSSKEDALSPLYVYGSEMIDIDYGLCRARLIEAFQWFLLDGGSFLQEDVPQIGAGAYRTPATPEKREKVEVIFLASTNKVSSEYVLDFMEDHDLIPAPAEVLMVNWKDYPEFTDEMNDMITLAALGSVWEWPVQEDEKIYRVFPAFCPSRNGKTDNQCSSVRICDQDWRMTAERFNIFLAFRKPAEPVE